MFEAKPKRPVLRVFVILLAITAIGTSLLRVWPGLPANIGALVAAVCGAMGLLFLQAVRGRSGNRDEQRRALLSMITGADPVSLAPEECEGARQLDGAFGRRPWYWAGVYALVAAVGAAFVHAIAPAVEWWDAFAVSAAACVYLVLAVASPWYSYRKWTRTPAWRVLASVSGVTLIASFGVFALMGPRSLSSIDPAKIAQAVAVALLLSLGLTSMLVGISRMRLREETQREARLVAEAERERLGRQNVQAELKLLQAQVEPHFLFNTLANVRHLMATEPASAMTMLDHLIRYLRTALPEIRAEGSTLGREVELARAYLEIMRLRLGGGLAVAIEVPEDLHAVPFPSLMLMTLVENAMKHGVGPAARGTVAIRASAPGGKLRVSVEDDGAGLGGTIGSGVGLANVRERLAALFGGAARLDLESAERHGTRATIEVPIA